MPSIGTVFELQHPTFPLLLGKVPVMISMPLLIPFRIQLSLCIPDHQKSHGDDNQLFLTTEQQNQIANRFDMEVYSEIHVAKPRANALMVLKYAYTIKDTSIANEAAFALLLSTTSRSPRDLLKAEYHDEDTLEYRRRGYGSHFLATGFWRAWVSTSVLRDSMQSNADLVR